MTRNPLRPAAPFVRLRARRRRAVAVRRALAAVGARRAAPPRGGGLPKDFSLLPVCPAFAPRQG